MLGPALIGIVAAGIVIAQRLLYAYLASSPARAAVWLSPSALLGVACFAALAQRYFFERRSGMRGYSGIPDLLIHIHSPANPDPPRRWLVRSVISFMLSSLAAAVGAEGAAIEFCQALAIRVRTRSSRWFEQRRRTDAATALAAGVAASFGAPFAGMLLPIELGIGGRNIASVVSAIAAFVGVRYASSVMTLASFDLSGALYGFRFIAWKEWSGILLISVVAAFVAALVILLIRYSQESIRDLFQTQSWMRTLAAGLFLFLIAFVFRPGHAPSWKLLEQVLWGRSVAGEAGLFFVSQLLGLSMVLAGIGSSGFFWPLFALGGFVGFGVDHWILRDIPGFAAMAGLAGGAAFWGAVVGAPLAGGILAFELTQNLHVLLPCLLAGFVAREVRRLLRVKILIEGDLQARGLVLQGGRSVAVLDGAMVRDAMVTDHETVHENEPVSQLHARLLKARYPFLPVVNGQGIYTGLITIDMVQEAWQKEEESEVATSNSSLSKLLEAKDLLYRAGFKAPVVRASDRLTTAAEIFNEIPCAPVLGDDGRVMGLLFVHNVRLAYEREMARRSLVGETREA